MTKFIVSEITTSWRDGKVYYHFIIL